jgi:hypothetical protein
MSRPDARLDRWLDARPDLARRIFVPAALKWEVRDKLDQANRGPKSSHSTTAAPGECF